MAAAIDYISRAQKKASIEAMGPIRVAVLGIAAYIIVFCLAPVTVVTPQSLIPYLYVAFCYFAFFCGCVLAQGPRQRSLAFDAPGDFISDQQLLKIHKVVLVTAVIGAALKLVDTFVIRGISLASTAGEHVGDLDSVGPNPVSIVCAIVMPACLLAPFTYQLLRQRGLAARAYRIVTHVVFLIPVVTSVLVAGRRAMILIYLAIYALYRVYLGRLKVTGKQIAILAASFIAMLALSTAIFNSRLEAMGLSPLDSVYSSGYAFTVQPQEWIAQVMERNSGAIGDVALSILTTSQYYLHGIFEFVYQYQNAPPFHIWGAASFNAFYKFLAYFLGWASPGELWSEVTVHTGVYTSFFGPVLCDFGWYGAFYMLALGALAQRLWQGCREGDIRAIPIYMYLVFAIFLFPFANLIVGSQGLYNLSAFALFLWLAPSGKKSSRKAYRYPVPLPYYGEQEMRAGRLQRRQPTR